MRDQLEYSEEEETLQGPIRMVQGGVIPKTFKKKSIFHAFDAINTGKKTAL